MPNKKYLKGVRLERKVVNMARKRGFLAARTAGSHSPIDLFIIDKARKAITFVQCRSSKKYSQNAIERLQADFSWLNGDFLCDFKVITKLKGEKI